MPLYEYHCQACDKTFEKIGRQQQERAACPTCGKDVPRIISMFAAGSCSAPAGSGFG